MLARMDPTAFTLRRWLDRFKTEERVVAEQRAEGRVPDATLDEVGAPIDNVGFEGRPLRSRGGNGYGSGDPSSPGWVGWGGHGGGGW
jgi:hypothetical protein